MPVDDFWKTRARRTVPAAFPFLAALLLPFTASADPPLPVMQRLNLLGTWAPSCSAPASSTNPYLVYFDDSRGTVGRQLDRGTEYPVLGGKIDSARQISPTRVALTVRNADPNWQDYDGMVFETEVEFSSNRTRTIRSTASNGQVFIADGKLNDGREIPALARCK